MFQSLPLKVEKNIEVKEEKDRIYALFQNFPESKKIYYTSRNLYSKMSIGPTIYQIDILAELTDEAYEDIITQIEWKEPEPFSIKINPEQKAYTWKQVKSSQIIQSNDMETASITKIYMDENEKTMYVIVLGGN